MTDSICDPSPLAASQWSIVFTAEGRPSGKQQYLLQKCLSRTNYSSLQAECLLLYEVVAASDFIYSVWLTEVLSMQRFVAELSKPIDQAAFEKSWESGQALTETQKKVDFVFAGCRVSMVVHSELSDQWPSTGFHRTFSAAVQRLDRVCSIRWL
jgi:hypothetical protein